MENIENYNAKLFMQFTGTTNDIEDFYDILRDEYSEFDYEETKYKEELIGIRTYEDTDYEDEDLEDDDILDVSIMFEGIWSGDIDDFIRLTHHADAFYDAVSDIHCEVCVNDEWYGGNEHKMFDDSTLTLNDEDIELD